MPDQPRPLAKAQALLQPLMAASANRPAAYSTSVYGLMHQTLTPPPFTTQLLALEESARLRLPAPAYAYAAGGASTEATMRANREAFDRFRIVPRMLRPVQPRRDLSRVIFGRELKVPIVMAPVGVQRLYHEEGEVAVARVFAEEGLPYTLSTASSVGMDKVSKVIKSTEAGDGSGEKRGIGWYQLYWPSDDDVCESYLCRARDHGFEVLVVTLDTFELSWRPRDLDTGFHPFIKGVGVSVGLEDPVSKEKLGFDATREGASQNEKELAYMWSMAMTARGLSPTWEQLAKLRRWWGRGRPIVLKGVQCVEVSISRLSCFYVWCYGNFIHLFMLWQGQQSGLSVMCFPDAFLIKRSHLMPGS